ncbi:MAG: hypothetical protein ABI549_12680 [Flavobacterium sp.]|uniref:hypothetical protein n=1 Tax=Flavobacterium sp. TaxID=239 RepID=UPI003267191B
MSDKINIIDEIESRIKKGLINGYNDNILFTQNYSDLQSRIIEYLIVVNVAQELKEYCFKRGIDVNLEYSLNNFYNNAFPSAVIEGDIFNSKLVNRKNHSPEDSKSKRLDIVLTSEMQNNNETFPSTKSMVGIEIKSINQANKKIKQDIIRLSKALNLTDPISENYIKAGFVCFFKRFDKEDKIMSNKEYEIKVKKELEKWQTYFQDLRETYTALRCSISEVKVATSTAENYVQNFQEHEYDFSEVAQNTGFINAYCIRIDRNE